MSASLELRAQVARMQARFREHYEMIARFREDRALAAELSDVAAPLLEALLSACSAPHVDARHDAYAQLTLLFRRAAELDATPSVLVTLQSSLVEALRAASATLDTDLTCEVGIVAAEAYCAAREERSTRALRKNAASSQVAVPLGPGCRAIFLAGCHLEDDLEIALDSFARDLLRDDIKSCLLDLSRLIPIDEGLARAIGRLCVHASTLGVSLVVVGAPEILRAQFEDWCICGPLVSFVDPYDRAQQAVLRAAGLEMRISRRWSRLFLPARTGLVR